ncbi:MAG: peptidyl-prolyl cis-trans isomerase [Chloroflexota bacterium]|jgi:parvulin-like peptidyl-prolyl isomerase|nr:peptidyl-prolyl cis-trans isomerase [Chloroflexota bacterium]
MTFRPRRQSRPGIGSRVRRIFEGEERQQAALTFLFIGAIVVVVLALVGSVALAWYNDNLRPLARIGSMEIQPQLMRDRAALQGWRIGRDQDRVTLALQNGEIDQATASSRTQALQEQLDGLATSGLDELIDIIYQSQLAPAEGINVTTDQVDALLAKELEGVEKRHMWEIVVKPVAADPAEGPTATEQKAALEKAQQALDAINAGGDWATIAHQFSNGDSEPAGGDLGTATANKIIDLEFQRELFELPLDGTTGIVRGADDAYRIGRVTEILPAGEQTGLRDQLFSRLPEAAVRNLLTYEVAAGALHDKITNDALAATPEQARIAVIYIDGEVSTDPIAAQGEVDYSEIVFAPGDTLDETPAADDPAWALALSDAQAIYNQLKLITDVEERKTKFAELALTSDSDTGQDGGSVGFVTRDLPPTAIGDALFTGTYAEGDLVGTGPIKGEDAYYVLMFNERRASVADRIQAVKDALAAPGADFNAIASEKSEGPEKKDGGEIGWLTKDQLTEEVGNAVFNLTVGQVSDPVSLGIGQYFIKLEEKMVRPLDPDQIPNIRATAFDDWYSEKKTAAEDNGTITRADDTGSSDGNLDNLPLQ